MDDSQTFLMILQNSSYEIHTFWNSKGPSHQLRLTLIDWLLHWTDQLHLLFNRIDQSRLILNRPIKLMKPKLMKPALILFTRYLFSQIYWGAKISLYFSVSWCRRALHPWVIVIGEMIHLSIPTYIEVHCSTLIRWVVESNTWEKRHRCRDFWLVISLT